MAAPCALVASCTELHPKELIKQILGVSDLPESEHVLEQIEAYPWHIDTKYYTVDVRLCTTEARTIGDQNFAMSVQAIVIYFETKNESSFSLVSSWLPYVKEIEPPVQLLVCERCKDSDAVSKQRALAWCLENAFELIEMEPEEDSDDEEDDFQETTGVKRIIQALHAHPWPNLTMKDKPMFRSPFMTQMMVHHANNRDMDNDLNQGAQRERGPGPPSLVTNESSLPLEALSINTQDLNENDSSVSDRNQASPPVLLDQSSEVIHSIEPTNSSDTGLNEKLAKELRNMEAKGACSSLSEAQGAVGGEGTGATEKSKEEKKKKNEEEKQKKEREGMRDSLGIEDEDYAVFAAMGAEDDTDGFESFEQLYEKMRRMKEKADTLPLDQRKKYAEQVAIQFWKAIGGEDSEIQGLSESDTED